MAVTTDLGAHGAAGGRHRADGLAGPRPLRFGLATTPPPPPCATPYETARRSSSCRSTRQPAASEVASSSRRRRPVARRGARPARGDDAEPARRAFPRRSSPRSNPAYAALVDEAAGGPAERAALARWRGGPARPPPYLSGRGGGWSWTIHQATDSVRDARQLRLFRYRALWGLSATPALEGEAAQQLYLLLAREKVHHPNLLAAVVRGAVRRGADDAGVGTTHEVALVTLTAEEACARATRSTGRSRSRCSTMSHAAGDEAAGRASRSCALAEAAHERSVRISSAARELDGECEEIAARCVEGTRARTLAALEAEAAREACEVHARDVQRARSQLATVRAADPVEERPSSSAASPSSPRAARPATTPTRR